MAGEEFFFAHAIHETGLQPGFVARVLKQSPHEIRHAGDHFADGDVFAEAQAMIDDGAFQLIGHAVEHLDFQRVVRQAARSSEGQRVCNRTRVVRADGELDARFIGFGRNRV